jgi:hypothetical protein
MSADNDPQKLFEQLAAAACQELFAQYGLTVRRATQSDAPVSPEFMMCSVIGFSGRHLRGALVLALTEELPDRSSPLPAAPGRRRDWVGELSNQLLGRVKIELLRRGVEIYLNLPAVLRGQHLAPLPRRELEPIKFTVEEGVIAVWLEIETSPGFQLDPGSTEPAGPTAGEALIFD